MVAFCPHGGVYRLQQSPDTVRAGRGADIIIDSRTRDSVDSGPGLDIIGGAAIILD